MNRERENGFLSEIYSVKQSGWNRSKRNIFHKPKAYEQHIKTRHEQKKTFARHETERVGVFSTKIIFLV